MNCIISGVKHPRNSEIIGYWISEDYLEYCDNTQLKLYDRIERLEQLCTDLYAIAFYYDKATVWDIKQHMKDLGLLEGGE